MSELFKLTWAAPKFKYYLFDSVIQKKTNMKYDDFVFSNGEKFLIDEELYTNHEPWGKNYTDFHHGISDEYYINERFLNCLKNVGEVNFQIYPISILPEEKPYFILNILNVIDCVDREKSKYNFWTEEDNRPDKLGKFRGFDKMVLDRSKVPKKVHLFRLYGYDVVTVVTKELVEEFEKNDVKGFSLIPVG